MSVNEKKWLVMHVHVQMRLDELRGPPNPLAHCDMKPAGCCRAGSSLRTAYPCCNESKDKARCSDRQLDMQWD